MNQDKFDLLIQKYQNGELRGAEKELMDQWFDSLDSAQGHRWTEAEIEELKKKILAMTEDKDRIVSIQSVRLRKWVPYAAAILLMATFGSLYYQYFRSDIILAPVISGAGESSEQEDILPGGNRATLTLSDGTVVELSEAYSGIVVGDGKVRYEDGEALVGVGDGSTATETPYAELAIPRGGQYQVVLPDGSKVWLNSASTLRYPLRFNDSERVVELEGEAYFEVAGQQNVFGKRIPFKVVTSGQIVDVLGTKFNVLAYGDEAHTKTTLVSGQVRVVRSATEQTVMLQPGEESVIDGSPNIHVRQANIDAAIAWKSGVFYFHDTPFSQMLQQIARWYDIEVVYNGTLPNEVFSGKMSRNVNLGVLVKFLKDSGIDLKVEGNKLIVKK